MKMHAIEKIIKHFKQIDPIIGSLTDQFPLQPLTKSSSYFASLAEAIISQQLSVKASDTIWKRLLGLTGEIVTPEQIYELTDTAICSAGISKQKCIYLKSLALAYISHYIDDSKFDLLSDEEIIDLLIQIKGIGRWTAEMFLMFALGREDVFSFGDLGLQNAIKRLYRYENRPSVTKMTRLSQKWKPYRTYAARLLWRSLG